jgi:hypothetical protein
MKQNVVSNDPASFSCLMFTYALVCAHKKVSEIDDQNRLIGSRRTPGLQLTNDETCIGLGRMYVSDSMLCQHIFDVNSFKMLNCQQIETPFLGSIIESRRKHNTKFQHNLKSQRQFCEFFQFFILPKIRIETPLLCEFLSRI